MFFLYRDLRPDNILLGERGHVVLTYFSKWGCVDSVLHQEALENYYAAPEVCGIFNVSCLCDWWSVGALAYELLTGRALVSCHPSGINSHTTINVPQFLSPEAGSLITELLRYNPNERLGSGINGDEEIKAHPFFVGLDWSKLQR
ncbi:PREDICTED: ribosomal protein S6 kinase delta-1-like [Priapulus caudatus]|uniref:Ribosomal protein S6 kinase delta-1-like n=1 Tax=Priapulus caudatus TaxID=37621 RepID=A0ABM1E2J2_PRICU|nr:PREDICTED: ribosomal protein S6 kinase delta-1-like [Priapulus caudatus]